jgi:hypothetical protein
MPRRPPCSPDAFTLTAPRQPPPWAVLDAEESTESVDWHAWEYVSSPSLVYSAPAAVSRGVGSLDVFARGKDNGLLWKTFDGQKWLPDAKDFFNLGGGLTAAPAAVAHPGGLIDVAIRGPENRMFLTHFDGAKWSPFLPVPVDFALQAGPGITSVAAKRLDTFHTGWDGYFVYCWSDGGGPWAYEVVPGNWEDAPAPYAWAQGRTDVFLRGPDGHLWHKWRDGQFWHEQRLPPKIAASPCVAAAGYPFPRLQKATRRVDCIVRGSDGRLTDYWWDGASSAGISDLPARSGLQAAAAVASGMGRVDVFALDTRGSLLHTWHEPPHVPEPSFSFMPSPTLDLPVRRMVDTGVRRTRLVSTPRRRQYATSHSA